MAYEITMSDEDRMALMQMVKEGKISTETAVSVVSIRLFATLHFWGQQIKGFFIFSFSYFVYDL